MFIHLVDEVARSTFSSSKKDDDDEDEEEEDEDGEKKSKRKDEDDSGKEHTAMDMLRKYGMHEDVQDIIDMRKAQSSRNQDVLVTTVRTLVEVRPAITSGHAHVVTDNEVVKKGEHKKRFPKVRWRSIISN